MPKSIDFRPVILAGGSGTRFWPRSRRARAKQVLALDGERSMIQQTVERLKPLASHEKTWVITNEYLAQEIADQLKGVPRQQIIEEPVARNTAPACGLAAFLIERENPDAVLGVFPSDHVIADEPRFLKALQKGIGLAAAGDNIVVLGIEPTRPETGYGYIETGRGLGGEGALRVRRFTEKPNLNRAQEFVAAGNYYWNSGMFLWSARTLANAVREHLPETAPLLEKIAKAYGTPKFEEVFREWYPTVREHFGGLCGAGATVGEGRARIASVLRAGGVCVERSGIVGFAVRVPDGDAAARRWRWECCRDGWTPDDRGREQLHLQPEEVRWPATINLGGNPTSADAPAAAFLGGTTPAAPSAAIPTATTTRTTNWYTAADPSSIDTIEYCYLEGAAGCLHRDPAGLRGGRRRDQGSSGLCGGGDRLPRLAEEHRGVGRLSQHSETTKRRKES